MTIERYKNLVEDKSIIQIPYMGFKFLRYEKIVIQLIYFYHGTGWWSQGFEKNRIWITVYTQGIIKEIQSHEIEKSVKLLFDSNDFNQAHLWRLDINLTNNSINLLIEEFPNSGSISEKEIQGFKVVLENPSESYYTIF